MDRINKSLIHCIEKRQKIIKAAIKAFGHPIIDDLGNKFESISEAARFYKCYSSGIRRNLKGIQFIEFISGRKFSYQTKEI